MITDPAFPTQRDKSSEPQPGFSKLEEASLRIFCAVIANPNMSGDIQTFIDGSINNAKILLTKIEAAQK